MGKVLLGCFALGITILSPEWKPPYTYGEVVLINIGLLLTFGTPLLIFFLILNRLVNKSFGFDNHDKRK